MALDHNLWKLGIENQFSTYTTAHVTTGGVTVATATITIGGAYVNSSAPSGSVYAAYRDLFERLHEGQDDLLPKLTTTQKTALTGVNDGRQVLDITLNRVDCCNSGVWQSDAGIGVMAPAAYGNMFEDSATGSAMNPTTKQWITASGGVFDGNSLISFLNHADGDRLVVGTGGAGDYMIVASCGQTNSGSNRTTMTVHINDVDNTVIKDDQNANSINHRALVANGILTLADNDYLTLHIADPDTPANVISVFDCHLTIQRIS